MKRTLASTLAYTSMSLCLAGLAPAVAADLGTSNQSMANQGGLAGSQQLELANLIATARADIASGQAMQAFEQLTLLEHRYAGQPRYDYWLGVAAARSSQWFESSIALQRTIQVDPRHAGARLELVGVYIQQGQLTRAELQLHTLQQLVDQGGAPAQASRAIARYTDIIEQRRADVDSRQRLFMVGVDVGYDSNYLNYPDEFDIFANTAFEGLAIFDADDTAYAGLRGNYWQRFEAAGEDFIEVTVAANSRLNSASAASDFNTDLLAGSVSYGKPLQSGGFVKMTAEAGAVLLDHSYYRAHSGVAMSTMHPVSAVGQWHNRLYLRAFKFEQSRFNFNSYGFDTSYRHQYNNRFSSRTALLLEREDTVNQPGRQGGNLWRANASARLTYQLNAVHQLSGDVQYQRRRYQADGFAIFNFGEANKRSDDAMVYRIEWASQMSPQLQANIFAQYRDQSSNIEFFDLNQVLVQGGIQYVF